MNNIRPGGFLLPAVLTLNLALAVSGGLIWAKAHQDAAPGDRQVTNIMGVRYDVPTSGLFRVDGFQYGQRDTGASGPDDPYVRDEAGHLYIWGVSYGRAVRSVRITDDGWVFVDGQRRGSRIGHVPP